MPTASMSSTPVLASKHHSPLKEPENSLKKRLVTDLGQRWMMSPGNPPIPESKEMHSKDDRGTGGRGEEVEMGGRKGALGGRGGNAGRKEGSHSLSDSLGIRITDKNSYIKDMNLCNHGNYCQINK